MLLFWVTLFLGSSVLPVAGGDVGNSQVATDGSLPARLAGDPLGPAARRARGLLADHETVRGLLGSVRALPPAGGLPSNRTTPGDTHPRAGRVPRRGQFSADPDR